MFKNTAKFVFWGIPRGVFVKLVGVSEMMVMRTCQPKSRPLVKEADVANRVRTSQP